jgi:hypothetical protein
MKPNIIKKFAELNESETDSRIHKISRYLSDYFYPNESKSTYPIKCEGFTENEYDYEAYFSIWENNKYKSGPISTILVPKRLIS